jgi:hypothetical protein
LNAGNFAIVQLYHISDTGTYEEPKQYREFWEVMPMLNAHGDVEMVNANRGPIFNRWGGMTRDYDPLFRKPIFSHLIDDPHDVSSGKIISDVRYMLGSIVKRVTDSARAKGRQLKTDAEAISSEMTDFLWREANKPDASGPTVAWKHAREDYGKQMDAYYSNKRDLESVFMPPPPPKGAV